MSPAPEVSIVIPAFNEELRLRRTLGRIHAYLIERGLRTEVIVVDDGSTDGTAKLVEGAREEYPEVRLVSNGTNRGKGFSVRHGMTEARGEIALFTDADLSAPIEEADKLLAAIREKGCDGAIGSRAVDRSLILVHQPALREFMGIVFNYAVRIITGTRFSDTQCGFKAFRREPTRIIFEQQRIEGFGFDPEILFLARRNGLVVAEIPVRWVNDPASKIHMFSDSVRMFVALLEVRWNSIRGRYPRKKTSSR